MGLWVREWLVRITWPATIISTRNSTASVIGYILSREQTKLPPDFAILYYTFDRRPSLWRQGAPKQTDRQHYRNHDSRGATHSVTASALCEVISLSDKCRLSLTLGLMVRQWQRMDTEHGVWIVVKMYGGWGKAASVLTISVPTERFLPFR